MAFYGGPQGATVISPPAQESYLKVGKVEVADGSTAFAAFALPKDAVIIGAYIVAMGANATQTINAGFTAGGTDILNAIGSVAAGYVAAGAATGSAVGTKLTADKVVYLKASATLTNPVFVKVEYYIPQQGMNF